QILSVTADKAASNETKVAELVPHFSGPMSRIRCFLHIVNLVAKSLICKFD
ncbi:hypothetical protein BDR07DRAFT_1210975, partial [Suillus spraguei]